MFKLKPGNVFQKINKMDRKQAYTLGAIVVVCFVALLTLASFLGNAEDSSFEDFNTRGYDLAQMPFVNDEAEQYLLASKYPDMQGNNSTMLYSAADKQARQQEDSAQAAEEAAEEATEAGATDDTYYGGGYSGGGYTGGGTPRAPTQVGQLSSASMSRSGGSGVNTSWGAPRGDFSPYKSQEKGSEIPTQTQLRNQDARRALAQFAQASRAAAGLKDGKGANAKRALMGANVRGSEAFTDSGVDLSKTAGLTLDTNAPVSTADLGNLDKAVSDAAAAGKSNKDKAQENYRQSMEERIREQLFSGMINMGLQAMGNLLNQGVSALQGTIAGNQALNNSLESSGAQLADAQLTNANKDLLVAQYGQDKVDAWMAQNPNGRVWQCQADLSGSGTTGGTISPVPTKPEMPQQSAFVSQSGSSNEGGVVTLGAQDQARYDMAMEEYNRQNEAYNAYQNASDEEKLQIRTDRMEANIQAQKQAVKSFSDQYVRYQKAHKTGAAWESAVAAKNVARTAYTGKSVIDTTKLTTKKNTSSAPTGGASTTYKTPNDFHTHTQYEDYVKGLNVGEKEEKSLLNIQSL